MVLASVNTKCTPAFKSVNPWENQAAGSKPPIAATERSHTEDKLTLCCCKNYWCFMTVWDSQRLRLHSVSAGWVTPLHYDCFLPFSLSQIWCFLKKPLCPNYDYFIIMLEHISCIVLNKPSTTYDLSKLICLHLLYRPVDFYTNTWQSSNFYWN